MPTESERSGVAVVVDDQSTGRAIFTRVVQSADSSVHVESFAEPLAAYGWLRDHRASLVLVDYRMPGLDGIEFIRLTRALPDYADTPIVMVTAYGDREVKLRALSAGVTDFLTKPVDYAEAQARCRNLLRLARHQEALSSHASSLEARVAASVDEIRRREQETLLRLALAGEYRDETTGYHVERMARYARLIAEGLGLPSEECRTLEMAAPMHDIGKIGIPDDILRKPSRHTREEQRIMRQHAAIGYDILKGSPSKYLQIGALIALGHHERWDGGGYPHGLVGEAIPLGARITAVADVFDALVSERPYKRAWTLDDAVTYVRTEAGKQFDPACVESFCCDMGKVRDVHETYPENRPPRDNP